jgi:hypothetical protein
MAFFEEIVIKDSIVRKDMREEGENFKTILKS